MRKYTVYLLLFLIVLAGCETVKGLGKDIENTGDNIQEAAEKLEKKIDE